MKCSVSHDLSADEEQFVHEQLVAFSDQFTAPRNYREFSVALRDERGAVVGGVTANTIWEWLQINVLWVAEDFRGHGYGYELLRAAEAKGLQMGCTHARVDTFEFEAREFYERCGYAVYAQLEDFPGGHTQFHLRRRVGG